jgi:hypothetical protein
MCHVFRCDSAPAKDIANTLRDKCRKILEEKKLQESLEQESRTSSLLKRPSFLHSFNQVTNETKKKIDIDLKQKSISFSTRSDLLVSSLSTSSISSTTQKQDFLAPIEEPKKSLKCQYLGSTLVNKPTGINILNDALEKIYQNAFENYKKDKKERQIKRRKSLMLKSDYCLNEENFESYLDDDEDIDEYECENSADSDLIDQTTETALTFDNSLLDSNERKLGVDVLVEVSPSTISVKKIAATSQNGINQLFSNSKSQSLMLNSSFNNSDDEEDRILFECRIRYLCFMGISSDIRLCGFIMHQVDNSFICHAFLCEQSSTQLCKTIEAACKLRYQKCLDAHANQPNNNNKNNIKNSHSTQSVLANSNTNNNSRFSLFGLLGSFKSKTLFPSFNSNSTTN